MRRFVSGEARLLVATTVIEVGVNVPNASVMVIENAERFGLSQLHQLRGRVGRGADQSFCVLVSRYELSAETRKRLSIMTETTNGFEIAEADLALRGPGDLEGTMQSGLPFRLQLGPSCRAGHLGAGPPADRAAKRPAFGATPPQIAGCGGLECHFLTELGKFNPDICAGGLMVS